MAEQPTTNDKPEEKDIPLEQANQTPSQPPQDSSVQTTQNSSWGSNWWGWGQSMVMSTVSQVGSTLKDVNDSYVKPTIGTVTKTTSQLVNDLATAIDAPEVESAATTTAETTTTTTTTETTTTTTATSTTTSTPNVEDQIFKYIDSSVSLLSVGAGYLSTTVSKSVETLANADIKSVVDTSKRVLDSSVQAAHKSLDIIEQGLEKVGSTAMSFLTEEKYGTSPRRRQRTGEFADESDSNKEKKEKDKDSAFEEHGGRKHFEALENLSVESLKKQQILLRKLKPEQSQNVTAATIAVQEIFDKEKHDENQATLPTFAMGEVEIAELNSLVAMFAATKEQLKPKSASVTAEFAEFVKNATRPEEVAEFIGAKQKVIREEGLQTIAKLGAISVKQLLNVAQWSATLEGKQTVQQLTELGTSICQLCEFFDQELTTASTLYVDAIQSLSLKGGESLAVMVASGASAEHVQGVKKQINLKTQGMRNLVYFDVGNAISHVQDSKRLLQNIIKFLVVTTEKVDV